MRRITGISLAMAVVLGAPGEPLAETLEEALVQAYRNNPSILAQRARLRAIDEGVSQALSDWRPTLSFAGDIEKQRIESKTDTAASSTVNRNPRSLTLSLAQSLYRGGRTAAATRQAEALVEAERAALATVEQTVMLGAATAYVDVVRDQAVIELNINNERVLQRQLEATRDRFEVGEVTRTDVAQAESRVARAKADRIGAEGALIGSRADYERLVGAAPRKLTPAGALGGLPVAEAETIALAKDKAFNVIEADFRERAARHDVREIIGELLPQVSLSADLSETRNTSGKHSTTDNASVTATLTVPLYESGEVSSRVRAAKQTVAERRNDRNQALRLAIEAATDAWERLQTARAQIVSFTAAVRATTIALEGVQQEALVGSRTVLDVLDAEQELLDARVSLVRAKRDEVVATYTLRAAVGQLTANQLGLPVKLYDPTTNYRRVRGKWFGIAVPAER